jgi:hypothetical protein
MKYFAAMAFLGLLAYTAWPYYHIWQLNQAAIMGDRATLSRLVDLPRVQTEIKKKLNKDVDSAVGEVSNRFVSWLQTGIQRLGNDAVEQLVTLDWVEEQLLSTSPAGSHGGFLPQVSYAFFDSISGFRLRIGAPREAPAHIRMRLQKGHWRVIAVYH